ncbi:ESCO1/2 acetyl-transferase-domain-containing protein [Dimargaris cristalligena]|uniref:ESCO1/2 acetyl-transferase-domain-containing protein n=1 Tax=Dimargaris cristalligena TaxID=215637 RepID=A0A4P9ZXT9_9FUNG|nr:ESCO1/2 acetyl-transferase-domain-containing protein [Dimargaris cristalligena]|eukprot:RKP38483.1 ESCO1/2 acetyl-transferase-domain-containing protein [Dimargaris cristalligena]
MASILSLKRQLNSHTEVIKTVASCPSTPLRKRTRAGLPKTPSSNHTTNFKQMYLQFGQKNLGPTLCSECGLSYQRGQSEDELLHDKYHQSIVRGVKYLAKEVMEVTNTNLGSAAFTDDMWSKYKVFLCISATQYVMGCAVVERIKTAYATTTRSSTDGVPASCGISRVWVSPRFRRQSVATELLEAVRENFIYGLTIARTEIAFSQPTAMGAALARHFTGRFDFLVYIE